MTAKKKAMSRGELDDELAKATEGLSFHSESDAPIAPYHWSGEAGEAPSAEAVIRAAGKKAGTPVEEESIHDLFDPVTEEQSFWSDDDRAEAARYKALVALLEEALTEIRVYRVGEVDIDVYVIGKLASGEWMGVSTHVVET